MMNASGGSGEFMKPCRSRGPTRMAFEANHEKIEGALADGNSNDSICNSSAAQLSSLRQLSVSTNEERAKRKKAADAKVTEEKSASKGDEKGKAKRKNKAEAAPKADQEPQTGAEEALAASTPTVQPTLPEVRPQPGKIRGVLMLLIKSAG